MNLVSPAKRPGTWPAVHIMRDGEPRTLCGKIPNATWSWENATLYGRELGIGDVTCATCRKIEMWNQYKATFDATRDAAVEEQS